MAREKARKRTIDEVEVMEIFCPFVRSFYCLMLVNYFQMMMYECMDKVKEAMKTLKKQLDRTIQDLLGSGMDMPTIQIIINKIVSKTVLENRLKKGGIVNRMSKCDTKTKPMDSGAGMVNFKNSCFLNSSLQVKQALSMHKWFIKIFLYI